MNQTFPTIHRKSLDQGVTIRTVPHLCLCPTKDLWAITT